jgi:hypothetical protein
MSTTPSQILNQAKLVLSKLEDMGMTDVQSTETWQSRKNLLQLITGTVAQESNFEHRRQMGFPDITKPFQLSEPEREDLSGQGINPDRILAGAFGYVQFEVATARDFFINWRRLNQPSQYWDGLSRVWFGTEVPWFMPSAPMLAYFLQHHDQFALAMMRFRYQRVPDSLPPADDIEALAAYWKQFYNTEFGRGLTEEFVSNWNRYLEPLDLDWEKPPEDG